MIVSTEAHKKVLLSYFIFVSSLSQWSHASKNVTYLLAQSIQVLSALCKRTLKTSSHRSTFGCSSYILTSAEQEQPLGSREDARWFLHCQRRPFM